MLSSKEDLKKAIATGKPIKYTLGFKYRHPTNYEIPVTPEQALKLADSYCFDVIDKGDWIDFNCYTSNDMW